jgi:hypothetical protein
MKQLLQNTLFGFVISLILSTAFVANAEPPKPTISQVGYKYYYHSDDDLAKYYRFLPSPAPEGLHYHARLRATANVDDTPEKETVVLIVVETKPRTLFSRDTDFGNRSHAFLLIANTKGTKLEKKAFFKLFDTGTHPLEVPGANVIELHSPPSGFEQPTEVFFRLVDVSDDGTLDIWVESVHGVALISFEDDAFKEVFSKYTVSREKLTDAFDVEYIGYDWPFGRDGQKYHRFLGNPQPENFSFAYSTRLKAIANIDDTPEKETIVLMVGQTSQGGADWGQWNQAFLLIAEADTETDALPKKKELFKLFASWTYPWDLPAKTVEFQRSPPVFPGPLRGGGPWNFQYASFDLVDLTGDGILDIWVEQAEGVAVISFQDGEFKGVCSGYSSPRSEDPIEYIDLDNDGIYEIKIPDRISSISGVPGAAYPQWMSLYEWDGNTYVLNNERFYAENDKFLIDLLNLYNHVLIRHGRFDEYSFCIGLVFYYRGNIPMAQKYLQWVANHGEKQHYVQTAEDILKKLPRQ